MRTHAGQIAFPGGAAEDGDHDLAERHCARPRRKQVDRSGSRCSACCRPPT
jgi:hypothetical protein